MMFKSPINFFSGLLFILFLLEASGIPFFTFSIPGFPLTLGRLSLVFLAMLRLTKNNFNDIFTKFNIVILLLLIGGFLGSFFSENLSTEIPKFFGTSLLYVTVIFCASSLELKYFKKILDYVFIFFFLYWLYYMISKTIFGGFETFAENYRENHEYDNSLINYHSFGLVLSNSFIYLFFRFLFKNKKFNLKNILFISISLAVIFLTESRSNFILTFFVLMLLISLMSFKFSLSWIFGLFLFSVVIISSFSYFFSSNELLQRRYSFVNDEDYYEQSTGARKDFIELTFKHFSEYPLGRGFSNNRVLFKGTFFQPHNQFLTFILQGGVFSFFAVLIWFTIIFSNLRYFYLSKNLNYAPYFSVILLTTLTMFTNDLSGAFFFLVLIFQSWLFSKKYLKFKV